MKTVFITGVGTGIGKSTCIKFLNEGFHVIGALRNKTHLECLLADASNLPGKIDVVFADLQDSDFVPKIQSQLSQLKIKELYALLNIAGVLDTTTYDGFDLIAIETVMRVNFSNPAMLISNLYPLVKKVKGNILNITSMSGYQGSVRFPGLSVYGASKAALSSMSESLACEFQNDEVHINALAIGSVNTQMLQNAFPDFQATISPEQMGDYIFGFATSGFKYHNGKTISVAITNP